MLDEKIFLYFMFTLNIRHKTVSFSYSLKILKKLETRFCADSNFFRDPWNIGIVRRFVYCINEKGTKRLVKQNNIIGQ